jgi:hypothetical protein
MSNQKIPWGLSLLTALLLSAAGPGPAAAQINSFPSTCTGINCASSLWQGQYRVDTAGRPTPFETSIFSGGGECVRIDVTFQEVDLEATLIGPHGFVWRNDDSGSGACPLCPLVKAIVGPAGWYTLQISHFAGSASAADFTVRYGRYNNGNPNCSAPTTPLVAEAVPKPADTGGTETFTDDETGD